MKTITCALAAIFISAFTVTAQENTDIKKETTIKHGAALIG